jgi:hypothetical protein
MKARKSKKNETYFGSDCMHAAEKLPACGSYDRYVRTTYCAVILAGSN